MSICILWYLWLRRRCRVGVVVVHALSTPEVENLVHEN